MTVNSGRSTRQHVGGDDRPGPRASPQGQEGAHLANATHPPTRFVLTACIPLPLQILETRTDSPEIVASLKALSTVYTENTPTARRGGFPSATPSPIAMGPCPGHRRAHRPAPCAGLRATIERRGQSINEEFLKASESAQSVRGATGHALHRWRILPTWSHFRF